MSKILFALILLFSLTLVNCNDRQAVSDVQPTLNPVGTYKVDVVVRTTTNISTNIISSGYGDTDCDLLSTIIINSDNTIEFLKHNYNTTDECLDFEIIHGTWEETASRPGFFTGDIYLNVSNSTPFFSLKYITNGDIIRLKFQYTVQISNNELYTEEFQCFKI